MILFRAAAMVARSLRPALRWVGAPFVAAILGVLPVDAVDWPHFGYDDQYTSFYPGKTKISPSNVRLLKRKWGLFCDDKPAFDSKGSPAHYKGVVYATVPENPLLAVDSCGTIDWEYGDASFWQASQPALSLDGVLFYFINDMTTTSLAAVGRNGKQIWTAQPVFDFSSNQAANCVPSVDEAKKTIYVVENTFFEGAGRLYALSKSTGKVLWYLSKENDGIGFSGPYVLLKGNWLFARAELEDASGPEHMMRLNASSKKVEITYDTPDDDPTGLYWEPDRYCLCGDILLVEYEDWGKGLVAAYKVSSRKILWKADLWGRSMTGAFACNTKRKRVYVPADTLLYALDAKTGKEIWSYSGVSTIRNPSVANGVVYFQAGTYVYALNEATGKLLFSYDLGREVHESAQVAIGNDTIYAWGSEDDGGLVALSLPSAGKCMTQWGIYNTVYCTPSGSTTFTGTVAGVSRSSVKTDGSTPATWEGYAEATPGKVTLYWTLSTTCAGSFNGTWTPSTILAPNRCHSFLSGVTSGGEISVGLYEIVDCGVPSAASPTTAKTRLIEQTVLPLHAGSKSLLPSHGASGGNPGAVAPQEDATAE
ncbi:MAG: PQQ-binding-like beta-propeller repeat protein [Acidobacteriota bacterium]